MYDLVGPHDSLSISLFSRVHATLHFAVSVGRSVGNIFKMYDFLRLFKVI